MYFWNIEGLKGEMARRPLSDRELLPYLVIFIALYDLMIAATLGEPANVWDYADGAMTVLLGIAGTIYLFFKNGGSNGRDFVPRYLAIGFVVGLRYLVLVGIPVIVGYTIAYGLFVADSSEETRWWDVMLYSVLNVFYYWRVGVHLNDTAARQARPSNEPV